MTNRSSKSVSNAACDDPTFVLAISLIAALEGEPDIQADALLLSSLGMARAELTDYGHRVPQALSVPDASLLADGLATLRALLTTMLQESTNLAHTLRIQAAQRILDQGVIY